MKSSFWLLACILVLLAGCASAQRMPPSGPSLPRPQPGYLHWLEKESMLSMAPAFISQVSQTERIWLNSSRGDRSSILLEASPNWVNLETSGGEPLFRRLAATLTNFKSLGFDGLYLGNTGEKDTVWNHPGLEPATASALRFDEADFGDEKDYEGLLENAEADGMQLGSTLLPAATGIGPDFFLSARNSPGRAGLYAMLSVPPEYWQLLPDVREEWNGVALSGDMAQKLADEGLIPDRLKQDALAWNVITGWAATGTVPGLDGQPRRWIYRFAGSPRRPVLLWQDPGGLARTVFSAAIIRQTGLLGQALLGLQVAPLMGLEPAAEGQPESISDRLSPGLQALGDLAAQIHRYGGWALQLEPVPTSAMRSILGGACDFCLDAVTDALVSHAFLHSDPTPLHDLYAKWLKDKMPVSRLARRQQHAPLAPDLLADLPNGYEISASQKLLQGEQPHSDLPANAAADPLKDFALIWRTGLPGLVFIDENELAGDSAALARTLHLRKTCGLARARLAGTFMSGPMLGILSQLPAGGWWLVAGNFSPAPGKLEIRLPGEYRAARDAATGAELTSDAKSTIFTIQLDGRQARNVVFYPKQTNR